MPDDLDRLLRDAPARFPTPSDETTEAVERRLLGDRRRGRRAGVSTVAVLAAVLVGIAVGHWVVPPDEPAVGAPSAPVLTIGAQPRVVAAGSSIGLGGAIVVEQQGERVTVEQRPCGGSWRYLTTVETDERGAWTQFAMPAAQTSYRAVWRGARSTSVSVAVRPFVLIRFGAAPRTLRALIPSAGATLTGRTVAFQRLVGFSWVTFRTARLHLDETAYGRTYVAEARHFAGRGTRLRAALLLAQARPCYVGSVSSPITF